MTFRTPTTVCVLIATLSGCAMAPAHADAWQPDAVTPNELQTSAKLGLPPGDNLGYEPAPSVVTDWPMDPPMPVPAAGPTLLASWRGAPAGWSPPGLYGPGRGDAAGGGGRPDTDGDGRGASCERGNASFCPRPPEPAVPGPLPLLGLGAAFAYSRKLRQRIR
jgi:hypothetical protein